MQGEEIRIIYQYKSIEESADVWIALCSLLKETNLLREKYEIDEDVFKTVSQIEKILRKESFFSLSDQFFDYSFGSVGGRKIQQLMIKIISNVQIDWNIWVKKLSSLGVFIYAWRYDDDYVFWQNNDSIESYKRHELPYEHLPMKPSGASLPFPQIEIDTGKNPGRNVFKTGYVEAVGSTMWLGDEFFPLTGSNKDTVKSADWLQVSELKPGILKIQAQENCFTQSEGKEADLQYKLRDLLYPGHD